MLAILEDTLIGHGRWCTANQNFAMLALSGSANEPFSTVESDGAFMALVREILALGQRQGPIRKDEDAGIMALLLLGAHAQRHMLAAGSFQAGKLKYVLRLSIEGMGARPAASKATTRQRSKEPLKVKAKRRT